MSGGESANALGGALAAISSSQVTLSHVTATNNTALGGDASVQGGSGFGGALYAEQGTVTLNVSDSFFQGNTAQGGNGSKGGLAGGGAIETHDATLTLDRTQVVGNSAMAAARRTGLPDRPAAAASS